jgi:hypothetical protein
MLGYLKKVLSEILVSKSKSIYSINKHNFKN